MHAASAVVVVVVSLVYLGVIFACCVIGCHMYYCTRHYWLEIIYFVARPS